jgi:predicted O-methyltransferase YrrM
MHLHDILDQELARFEDKPIRVVETGTIRDAREETGHGGDGWSTIYFAERHKRTAARYTNDFVSIDLDTSIAESVLRARNLRNHVYLVRGHSIWELASLAVAAGLNNQVYDVAFLDSDNDAKLIFHEFLIAQHLVRAGGLIIIDDVRMPHHPVGAFKGDIVWPYVQKHALKHHIVEREGWNGYKAGVLVIGNDRQSL